MRDLAIGAAGANGLAGGLCWYAWACEEHRIADGEDGGIDPAVHSLQLIALKRRHCVFSQTKFFGK